MNKVEALEALGSGYGIITVAQAQDICASFEVPFAESLIMQWENNRDAIARYAFVPASDEHEGVGELELGLHICVALQLTFVPYLGKRKRMAEYKTVLANFLRQEEMKRKIQERQHD